MMTNVLSQDALEKILQGMDGHAYHAYEKLSGLVVAYSHYSIHFKHIQGSPGAAPASLCRLDSIREGFQIPEWVHNSPSRLTAAEDYILRTFNQGVALYAQQNRGDQGSGSFQPVPMPQQILKRNIVQISKDGGVSISFRISLPGSLKKKVLHKEALQMFNNELPAIIKFVKNRIAREQKFREHCECAEDIETLQDTLSSQGLVAFIGDGSLLPRESGTSDMPARFKVVPFKAPPELATLVDLPNGGRIRGMGIRSGITAIIGGGYHGKSTLLNALAKAIYPHVPGDGREQVIADKNCVTVSAENGRSIKGLDISSFINKLPQGSEPKSFSTDNASGSTSEAAAIVENVLAGAKLLLIDEDSSATNFLIRDHQMRELIPDDPITPLFDRVRELHDKFDVSTVIVTGGSSSYLGVADNVVAMRDYIPVDITARVKALNLPLAHVPTISLSITDRRRLSPDNFNPEYTNERLKKNVAVRIKPLRGQEREIIEYGLDRIDIRCLRGVVDPDQLLTIGYSLLLARQLKLASKGDSPTALARKLMHLVNEKGLDILQPSGSPPIFFARIRLLELAGALNRLPSLKVMSNER